VADVDHAHRRAIERAHDSEAPNGLAEEQVCFTLAPRRGERLTQVQQGYRRGTLVADAAKRTRALFESSLRRLQVATAGGEPAQTIERDGHALGIPCFATVLQAVRQDALQRMTQIFFIGRCDARSATGPRRGMDVVIGMARTHHVGLATLREPVAGVFAHGFEHSISEFSGGVLHTNQPIVQEDLNGVEHRFRRNSHDGLRRGQTEPADEYSQRPQHALFVRRQQLIAPVNCRAHGPVPRRQIRRSASQQSKPIGETPQKFRRPEKLDARRGKLDGQWQSIQPATDLGDSRDVAVGKHEFRIARLRALDEQLNGVIASHAIDGRDLIRRRRQRRNGEFALAVDSERSPTGDKHARPRTTLEEPGHGLRTLDHLLEIVDYKQHRLARESLDERLDKCFVRTGRYAQRLSDQRQHAVCVFGGEAAEVDKADLAKRATRDHQPGCLNCQPGLSNARCPGQGDDLALLSIALLEQTRDHGQFPISSNEAGRTARQLRDRWFGVCDHELSSADLYATAATVTVSWPIVGMTRIWHRAAGWLDAALRTESSAPSAAPSIVRDQVQIDVAPDDPILAYFQRTAAAAELDSLDIDSPAIAALRAAGMTLVVPMRSQGELVGLLSVGPRLSQLDYAREDRRLLEKLADQAAPAVRLAQLARQQQVELQARAAMQQELEVARAIQQYFLPKTLPALPGWRIDAHYRPARAVGGDFYDFIPLPDNRLGIVIGDVADKGVPAALMMAATRSVLRASVLRLIDPADVLGRVNDLLVPDTPPHMFVTCFCAVLDQGSGDLTYANAGHDPPYVRTAAGEGRALQARGMPLGVMPGYTYRSEQCRLAPGEHVLFYSDGLVEAHNPQRQMFGFERLQELMARHAHGAADLVNVLLAELDTFVGTAWEQEDDITLVSLERTTEPEVMTQFSVQRTLGNERAAIARVLAATDSADLQPDQRQRLETALAEATINAIEHADITQSEVPIQIRVLRAANMLTVVITNPSTGATAAETTKPDLLAKLEGRDKPRGWGLFLMKRLADGLTIRNDGGQYIVELSFRLGGHAG
jgi:serine phosphatase RsbU (regulator of sigma subunit)/anti-sigma regulatory factor (Ser/Thr protein kinase)